MAVCALASVGCLVLSSKAPTARAADPLTWAPPQLTNPITIEVKNDGTVGGHAVSMDTSKDYIIKLPKNEALIGGLHLNGGRNIHVIGGEITIPMQPTPAGSQYPSITNRRMMKTQGATGTVHIEGILGRGPDISEGIQLISPNSIVQVQNVRIEHLRSRDQVGFTDNHPDLIQLISGHKEVRIDKFTGSSDYQGFFLCPKAGESTDHLIVKRTNIIGDPTSRQLFWMCDTIKKATLDQVWIINPTGYQWGFRRMISPGEGDPAPRFAIISTDPQGRKYATWPTAMTNPSVTGRVTEGTPPTGDFVPVGVAGSSYVSPGYLGATTPSPSPLPSPTPTIKPSPSPTPTLAPSPTPKVTPTPSPAPQVTPSPTPAASLDPSPSLVYCRADINQDRNVDITDYSVLVANFFKTSPTQPRVDINKDGIVDVSDLSIMAQEIFVCQAK
jgi:hypothetical protein